MIINSIILMILCAQAHELFEYYSFSLGYSEVMKINIISFCEPG